MQNRTKLQDLHSKPVTEMIPELLQHLDPIQSVTFVLYKPAPAFSERLRKISDPHTELHKKADQLNREYGIPFWDALLSMEMKSGVLPKEYVELAILHDSHPDERSIELAREEVSGEKLSAMIAEAGTKYGIAMSSRVRLRNDEWAHIPMLDFRCEVSERNRDVVKWALAALGQRAGAIVDSGRSFHFYGFNLLKVPEWIRFVSLASLFSPVVDGRYLAHRLADGACRLRITEAPRKVAAPKVLEVFHDDM
jgi:hypothetical protein